MGCNNNPSVQAVHVKVKGHGGKNKSRQEMFYY